jgi:uncharacterized protein with HEPN domain
VYEKLKEEIPKINSIVEFVPEPFKGKCFELLLDHFLRSLEQPPLTPSPSPTPPEPPAATTPSPPATARMVIPARVRAFLKRNNLDEDAIEKLILIEGEEVHFIKEPRDVPNAVAQIQWALLLGLRSALLGGAFDVDPEAVRSICIEKGFYDKANFAAIFKRKPNANLFKDEMVAQGPARGLSDKGEEELASLIRSLTG